MYDRGDDTHTGHPTTPVVVSRKRLEIGPSPLPTAVKRAMVGSIGLRPAGILTHVGSVLRHGAEEASPVLRVLSSFSTIPFGFFPSLSRRKTNSPRESSTSSSSLRSPSLTPPPALPPSSASSSCRYHYQCPRHPLPPTMTTTTMRRTMTTTTLPPPPLSPGLPHLRSRPGGFPTT